MGVRSTGGATYITNSRSARSYVTPVHTLDTSQFVRRTGLIDRDQLRNAPRWSWRSARAWIVVDRGNFSPATEWMREKIEGEGAREKKNEKVGANATTGDGCRDAWKTWRRERCCREPAGKNQIDVREAVAFSSFSYSFSSSFTLFPRLFLPASVPNWSYDLLQADVRDST